MKYFVVRYGTRILLRTPSYKDYARFVNMIKISKRVSVSIERKVKKHG